MGVGGEIVEVTGMENMEHQKNMIILGTIRHPIIHIIDIHVDVRIILETIIHIIVNIIVRVWMELGFTLPANTPSAEQTDKELPKFADEFY